MGPSAAVAAVRSAVRATLTANDINETRADADADRPSVTDRPLALVACSGGADSVALAAAAAFEGPKLGWRVGGVTVDHGLQSGSADRAKTAAVLLADLGLEPVDIETVEVTAAGGPEAAARAARYDALDRAAVRTGARMVLLGHTLDDQAETVLLGLARGSGTRSLAGMAATSGADGRYRRPLLGLDRATTRAACADLGLAVWDDPHNADPAFTRVRVRERVLPLLEAELGPGVAAALARTADLARDDADALDGWADAAYPTISSECSGDGPSARTLDVALLAALPAAVRRRVLRRAAVETGSPAGALGAIHLQAMETLVTDWHGQGQVSLPGGRTAHRQYGKLYLDTSRDTCLED
jgi:tRNA(Ile)-lysidine synthase